MSRIAYVAGHYVPHRQAAVHIEDRGFQFADGVYEVIAVNGGHLVDEAPHLARLHRSLGELRIAAPIGDSALKIVIRGIIRRAAEPASLNGGSRLAMFDSVRREGSRLIERPFTVAEAKAAREAFLTSTTAGLLSVVRIADSPVGEGRPGPLGAKLRAAYFAH